MYGLDADFLADLGLEDMLNDHLKDENFSPNKDPSENMTFEDLR